MVISGGNRGLMIEVGAISLSLSLMKFLMTFAEVVRTVAVALLLW